MSVDGGAVKTIAGAQLLALDKGKIYYYNRSHGSVCSRTTLFGSFSTLFYVSGNEQIKVQTQMQITCMRVSMQMEFTGTA